MPKKLGTCTKALESRERLAEKKRIEKDQLQKNVEDEYWKDESKLINRKDKRKEDRDAKRQELINKKKEKEKLFEEELEGVKCKSTKNSTNKLTQSQISNAQQNLASQLASLNRKQKNNDNDVISPNLNKGEVDGLEARTVEEAISILELNENDSSNFEKHPERRLKAAFKAFEERMLPQLREENPGLKLSQLKQMVFKLFQTSSENPKNQVHTTYNTK